MKKTLPEIVLRHRGKGSMRSNMLRFCSQGCSLSMMKLRVALVVQINNMPSSFLGGHSTRGGSVSGEHGDGGEDAGNFQHSTFQCTVANSVGQLTKLFRMYRLNRPGEAFFRSKFLDITPTSARVRVQLPIIEDAKEEMTEYLFQIDEAGQLDQKPELRPIVPVNYNG